MKLVVLVVKLALTAYLGYLVFFFLSTNGPAGHGYRPPFVLWVLDTMNLFIHEGGHFLLRPFGMWIYVFAGSFVQCALPFALAFVLWRQNQASMPYAAFWFGENLVNVSYYIKDAPYKHLRLLASGLIHDWNWLLSGNLDSAEWMGDMVWGVGVVTCVVAVGLGIYFAVRGFLDERDQEEDWRLST